MQVVRWLLVVAVAVLGLIGCMPGASKPSVVILSPPSGSQFFEGEEIAVQSTATDAQGVVRVELLVNGSVVRVDPSPTAQGQPNLTLIQTWKAIRGTHTIVVRAYNAAGIASDPVGVSIVVAEGVALAPTPTAVPGAPTAIPPSPTAVAPPAATPTSPAPPGTCTNSATFIQDVTVPDGTSFAPGQAFNKIWQVRNTGTCTWTGYQLVFVSGNAMTASTTATVPTTAPGATADLLVPMVAPATPGTHSGQWRLRSPTGLFGPTLTVSIVTTGSAPPAPTAMPSPTATPPPPPPAGCSGTPSIASFTASASGVAPAATISVLAGTTVTLSWGAVTNADSAEIDQGIGGVETPGSRTVTATSTRTYTLTARCGSNIATRQVTVNVSPLSITLLPPITIVLPTPPVPAQVSPTNGWVFRNFPRTATFTWNAVTFSGSVTYNIEIEKNTGTWQNHVTQTGLTGTTYTMPAFPGDNEGRWRVWATAAGGSGNKSEWRTFSFKTGAAQYAGTWINEDAATTGVTRIIITHLGGQNLRINPYGKCHPTDCNWGIKDVTFNGEPLTVTGFSAAPANTLVITLENPAGTRLKAVYTNLSKTYYFYK